jgi:hypothetical protein
MDWEARPASLTMTQVSGQGTCVGQVPKEDKKLCATIYNHPTWNASHWIIPAEGAWWACSLSGLIPHLAGSVFNASREFCLMVIVVPRILYHPAEHLILYWSDRPWAKREPITTLTIATLFGIGLAGAGTGIASLTT